jgi:nickel-dependent lactate racemase
MATKFNYTVYATIVEGSENNINIYSGEDFEKAQQAFAEAVEATKDYPLLKGMAAYDSCGGSNAYSIVIAKQPIEVEYDEDGEIESDEETECEVIDWTKAFICRRTQLENLF